MPTRHAKALAFRPISAARDRRTLLSFGRGLYLESLGDARAFERDYGPGGVRFPLWIASCGARRPAFAAFLQEAETPIGMVVLGGDTRRRGVGHVHHFYVCAERRGQGFGGLLDDYARATLMSAGYDKARLNVTKGNMRARRFYQAQGWEDVTPTGAAGGLRHMEVRL